MEPGSDLERQLAKINAAKVLFGPGSSHGVQLGAFTIVRMLGRGAMGTVFEAWDTARATRVALKVLHDVGGAEAVRIKREFRSLAGVVHPSLVALHELFYEEGHWFFTMELVEGIAFDLGVRSDAARFDETRLRSALQGLAAAVRAIHAAGKLHRDLKPTNVLVTPHLGVKVLDFGLVRDAADAGELQGGSTGLAGTPAYMAPEVAAGERASEASDWYAVGAMIFEALTGRLPFVGTALEILRKKQQAEAPRADSLCAEELPGDLVELCSGLLRRDPSLRLDAAAVLDGAGAASHSVAAAPTSPVPFVGRTDELMTLQQALSAACRENTLQLVFLGGLSGIGKSALLERFAAETPDTLVLSGRCYEQESVPYKVFDGVVESLARYLIGLPDATVALLLPRYLAALVQLYPVLASVPLIRASSKGELADPREQRSRAFGALRELLLRLTDHTRVAVLVDDLQWGDTDSILMLKHLFGSREPLPLLFAGTFRCEALADNAFLQELFDPSTFHPSVRQQTLRVSRLPIDAATALVRSLSQAPEIAACADAIVAEADGVPFFIVELVHVLEHRRAAYASAPCEEDRPSLDQVVLQRLSTMPDVARRTLDVMSVAAAPIELAFLQQAAGLAENAQLILPALRAARLVRTQRSDTREMVELYHDRMRQALVARLSPELRSAIHARIANVMEQGDADPERVIAHLVGAGELRRAGDAAVQAAHSSVQKLAFNRAAELFEQAIRLLPRDVVARGELYVHLGAALASAGRGARAADAYLLAAASAPTEAVVDLQRVAAQQYLRSGRTKEGLALAEQVLTKSGVCLPKREPALIAAFMVERARLRAQRLERFRFRAATPTAPALQRLNALRDLAPEIGARSVLKGALLQTRFLREALTARNAQYTLQALVWEVYNASMMGGPGNERWTARLVQMAIALGDELRTPQATALVQFAEAARLLYSGHRYRDAIAPLLSAKQIFATKCTGALWERGVMTFLHLLCLEFTGSLADQVHYSTEALRDADERDDRFLSHLLLLSVPYAHLIRDDPAAGLEFLDRERAWLEPGYDAQRHLWLLRMLDTLIYKGAGREALALLVSHWPQLVRSHIYRPRYMRDGANWFKARCALAAYAEAPGSRALALARDAVRGLRDATGAFGACGQALAAGLHTIAGDPRSAVKALESACWRLRASQADVIALYSERRLFELRSNHDGAEQIDHELRLQRVANPERWLWTHMPIRVDVRA